MRSCRYIQRPAVRILLVAVLACLGLLFADSNARADEPAGRFLQALRERGYYDVAIHYLDGVAESSSVSDAFKKKVAFEKASVLIESVR